MATTKRKTTAAVVAGVAAAALLLGGTFAWVSISQEAKNESAGVVNVGGRLHDDFNGTNKDIYVENFTNPLDGGQPIYARIRLDEYMEIGSEAGLFDTATGKYMDGRNATPVVDGTDINDVSTWTPHVPSTADCIKCTTGDTCFVHDHWTWTMGGETVFMPTFNRDKDSLKSDVNGSYEGTTVGDTTHFDDYMEYTTDTTGQHFVVGTDTYPVTQKVYQKTDTEYYDDDTDLLDNGGTRQVANMTHTAKNTANATVMLMTDWQSLPDEDKVGPYWVYDNTTGGDGWAYWAMPIMPGEATGLLLNSIEMTKNPGDKCYYAINVVAQFATAGDWEPFGTTGGSPLTTAAETLLELAVDNVPAVTVTNTSGSTFVTPGQEYTFSADIYIGGNKLTTPGTFEWSVLDADGNVSTTSKFESGKLIVGATETSATLTVVARSADHAGAVGVAAVGVRQNVVTTDSLSAPAYALLTVNDPAATTRAGETYTLSFIRSEKEPTPEANLYGDKEIVAVYSDVETTPYSTGTTSTPWTNVAAQITSAVIVNDLKPTYIGEWFYRMGNLTDITGLEKIDTSNVLQANGVFANCYKLGAINGIEDWDLSKAVSVDYMFYNCQLITSLDLSGWDLSSAELLKNMFDGCNALSSIGDISGWNVQNAENVTRMFYGCAQLQSLNFTGWDVSNVTSMQGVFNGCSNLTTITGIGDWDVSNVTDMQAMFAKCASLTSLDLSGWAADGKNTGNVTTMHDMFNGCTNLTTITGIGDWDVSNVTTMINMFYDSGITTLDLSGWATGNKTKKVEDMQAMFYSCDNLTEVVGIGDWDVSNVRYMQNMFHSCSSLTTLDLADWDVGNVTTMYRIFYGCSSLGDEDVAGIGDWDVSNVTNMFDLFHGCSNLQTVNLSNWAGKTGKVETIDSMFQNCSSLQTVDLSGWDTSKVTTTQEMFWNCRQLTTINGIGGWDVSSLEIAQTMFGNCTSLASITGIENWNVSSVKDMKNMFLNCSALTADLSGWTVTSVTDNTDFSTGASGVVLPTAWQTTPATTTTTAAS